MCGMKLAATFVVALTTGAAFAVNITVDGVEYHCGLYDGYNPKRAVITKIVTDNKTIRIPDSLNGYPPYHIETGALQNNTTVMKVVIPESVKVISQLAFDGCVALTSCNIPSGVTEIPSYCFRGCTKLRSIVLPKGLKSIGSYAFADCYSLDTICLPDGLERIDSYAFHYCTCLKEVVVPESVVYIDSAFRYCEALERLVLPQNLTFIPSQLCEGCSSLKEINIPSGVTSIEYSGLSGCNSLEVTLPAGLVSVGWGALVGVKKITFLGKPPAGFELRDDTLYAYSAAYGAQWQSFVPLSQTIGHVNSNKPVVTLVSCGVRPNAPTILDVVYRVTSKKPTVKVRVLAFEDGVRSLAKVTRPETFVADVNGVATAGNVGDAVAANVEHTLSWQVSTDFKTDLAKMKFEVLAVEDDILPLEFITIPANGSNKAMEVSWNAITEDQVFDALLWLYAAKTEGLTLVRGVLKDNGVMVAHGTSILTSDSRSGYDEHGNYVGDHLTAMRSPDYVFSKMGYSVLSGTNLTYANEMTRMGLSPSVIRQYAYKWID